MQIPTEVKVGGHIYKVIQDYKFQERLDIHGQCDQVMKEIRIMTTDNSGRFAQSKIEEIFIHELIHAINHVYNADELDEKTLQRLGEGFHQVLKDNFFKE